MRSLYTLLAGLVILNSAVARDNSQLSFRLTLDDAARVSSFSGRVFVVLSRVEPRPIVRSLNWFNPEPTFAMDVKDWKAGKTFTIDSTALSYPYTLTNLPKGRYYAQAIVDRDLGGISCFSSPGNLYSIPKRFDHEPAKPEVIELTIAQTVDAPEFPESQNVKLVDIPSPKLTAFHKKPKRMRAGVVLPPSYFKDQDRKFPVVYEVTGFNGDHFAAKEAAARKMWNVAGTEVIWVVLDGNCRLGHHVFADSANNGPVGTALVEELIPHIEKTFRGIGTPGTRLVTGHSSGGWSSLWLQVAYPDTFGGCWSTSPDPVDFRDFQRVNLYEAGANLFTDSGGQIRELSRGDRGRTLSFKGFSGMEDVMGRGGQLASFEAVFSPKTAEGSPRKMWDRKTGEIDPVTAKAWEPYDIRLKLEREWKTLGPKLSGKLHVWMGDVDTFYLDGATRLLKESQLHLKSDAVVEMFPGKTHGLVNGALRKRMNEEMSAVLKKAEKVVR